MFSVKELLELWANDKARREFINNYKVWGVWFTQPELDLTFYKFDLPGGGRIIALEYLREPYASERHNGSGESVACHKFYLQRGKYFDPFAASDSVIAERLKNIKVTLTTEQKQRDMCCKRCGGKCFKHGADGSVACTICGHVIREAAA